jgi:RNA polymerase sporulation-specific sigma factor
MIRKLLGWMKRVRAMLLQPKNNNGIYYIGTGEVLPAPLSREREQQLLYALREGDESARAELVEHNIRLVVYLARRFENTGICLEDLISIGTIGLMKAVNTFNVDKNIKLATYASRCIENEILMHLRKVGKERSEVSFDEPLNTDWDGNELLISDVLGTEEDIVERPLQEHTSRQLLFQAMDCLSERERRIISMRFGLGGIEECTQKEIADVMGISQSYISRLEKRIILRLRRELERIG